MFLSKSKFHKQNNVEKIINNILTTEDLKHLIWDIKLMYKAPTVYLKI